MTAAKLARDRRAARIGLVLVRAVLFVAILIAVAVLLDWIWPATFHPRLAY